MNPAAPFGSILFDRPSDRGGRDDPSMFGDLNLDQVFAGVAAGRDEYELTPFFRAPLRDVRAVEYRHEVQRDLEDEAVAGAVAEFADCCATCASTWPKRTSSATGTRKNTGSWLRPASTGRPSPAWRTRSPRTTRRRCSCGRSGGPTAGAPSARLPPGEPLPTSYGQDLYQSVSGTADQAARV